MADHNDLSIDGAVDINNAVEPNISLDIDEILPPSERNNTPRSQKVTTGNLKMKLLVKNSYRDFNLYLNGGCKRTNIFNSFE